MIAADRSSTKQRVVVISTDGDVAKFASITITHSRGAKRTFPSKDARTRN